MKLRRKGLSLIHPRPFAFFLLAACISTSLAASTLSPASGLYPGLVIGDFELIEPLSNHLFQSSSSSSPLPSLSPSSSSSSSSPTPTAMLEWATNTFFSDPNIPHRFNDPHPLGEGSFGQVWSVKAGSSSSYHWVTPGRRYALKFLVLHNEVISIRSMENKDDKFKKRAHDLQQDLKKECLVGQALSKGMQEAVKFKRGTQLQLLYAGFSRINICVEEHTDYKVHGYSYVVLELAGDASLASLADNHTLNLARLRSAVKQILTALFFMANLSPPLIHHDLKPANVMVELSTFRVSLIDLGAVVECYDPSQTELGVLSPDYAPAVPQLTGHAFELPCHSFDSFSVGSIIFDLLTGAPFYAAFPSYPACAESNNDVKCEKLYKEVLSTFPATLSMEEASKFILKKLGSSHSSAPGNGEGLYSPFMSLTEQRKKTNLINSFVNSGGHVFLAGLLHSDSKKRLSPFLALNHDFLKDVGVAITAMEQKYLQSQVELAEREAPMEVDSEGDEWGEALEEQPSETDSNKPIQNKIAEAPSQKWMRAGMGEQKQMSQFDNLAFNIKSGITNQRAATAQGKMQRKFDMQLDLDKLQAARESDDDTKKKKALDLSEELMRKLRLRTDGEQNMAKIVDESSVGPVVDMSDSPKRDSESESGLKTFVKSKIADAFSWLKGTVQKPLYHG